MKKRVGLKDFYLDYPHKCQLITSSTVPLPYVSKKDMDCDSKYALSYNEWKEIMYAYCRIVIEYLMTGASFKFPYRMGHLRLEVLRSSTYKDYNKDTSEGVQTSRSKILGPNSILIRWYRLKKNNGNFTNKWQWRCRLTKNCWRNTVKIFSENLSLLNNLNQCKPYS